MGIMKLFNKGFKKAGKVASNPNYLTAASLVLWGATLYLGISAYEPTKAKIEEFKEREKSGEDIPIKEKVTSIAKLVWKPVVTGIGAGALQLKANHTAMDKIATLGSTLEMYATVNSELKRQIEKNTDPETAEKITTAVDDKLADVIDGKSINGTRRSGKKDSYTNHIIDTGHGNQLFLDKESNRFFLSSADHIEAALARFKLRLKDEMYLSLNELYCELGLDSTGSGERLGWSVEDVDDIRIKWSGEYTYDFRSYIMVDFSPSPRSGFQNLHG